MKLKYFSVRSPEYILVLAVFVAMFALMVMASACRFFGVTWFVSDISVFIPSLLLQEIIKFTLRIIESLLIYKVISHTKWRVCLLVSVIASAASALLPGNIGIYFDYLAMLGLALYYVRPWGNAVLRFLIVANLLLIYGVLCQYSRISVDLSARTEYRTAIELLIDYKLLPVNMYLFDRLRGCKNVGLDNQKLERL